MQINKIGFSQQNGNSKNNILKNAINIEQKPNTEYSNYSTDNLKANYLVNFKGNMSVEESDETVFGKIYHTTRFFREPMTDKIVQNYILDNFSYDSEVNIVSGACSTGEEAKSYAMMLDDLGDKLHVFGFDISDRVITQAKEHTSRLLLYGNSTINDEEFLLENYNGHLTPYQRKCREKFISYFDYEGKPYMIPIFPNSKEEFNINGQNNNIFIIKNTSFEKNIIKGEKTPKARLEQFYTYQDIRAKEGSFSNCEFKQGDVLNLEQLYKPNSVNVLLYRNALYHTLCKGDIFFERFMKEDAPEQMESIAKQMNKVVKKQGLVVFGEDEFLQGIDSNVINESMKNNGFKKLTYNGKELNNVWVKVEDIE